MNEGFNRFNTFGYHGGIDLNEPKEPAENMETPSSALESNPILTKLSDGEVPTVFSGDRIDNMIKGGFDNVGKFGRRTGELLKNVAEKGGALFIPLITSGKEPTFKITNFTSLADEPTHKAEVAGAKVTAETSAKVATEEKDGAKAKITELPRAVTPERLTEARAGIGSAAEKTVVAGTEKLNLFQLAVLAIRESFRRAKRGMEIKATEFLANSEDPEVARKGKETLARLRPKLTALERLRALYPNLSTSRQETPKPISEDKTNQMPILEDGGIIGAFAAGARANENTPGSENVKQAA